MTELTTTAYQERTVDFPAKAFNDVIPKGIGMDIGGTLIKVAHASRPNSDTIRIHLNCYQKDFFDQSLMDIKNNARDVISPGQEVYTTGIGCNRYENSINKNLDIKIKNVIEMDCNSLAMKFLSENLPMSEFVYPPSQKAEPFIQQYMEAMMKMFEVESQKENTSFNLKPQTEFDSENELQHVFFPCVGCFMGSGAFYSVINEDNSHNFIDINTSCGRMLMGLGSLLTGAKSFTELLSLAEEGNAGNVDHMVGDMNDAGGTDIYALLPPDLTMYCFGKANGKSISDFKREDLAAALISQMAQSIAQACNLIMVKSDMDTLFFGGTVCCESELMRDEISKHFGSRARTNPTGKPWRYYFLRHGSYIGAIGALLLSNKKS